MISDLNGLTGIPKIRRSMRLNGSPNPTFDTNEARSYFLVILPIHLEFSPQPDEKAYTKKILTLCLIPHSRYEILNDLEVNVGAASYRKYIQPLIQSNLLQLTIPDKPKSKNQKYVTTSKGEELLEEL